MCAVRKAGIYNGRSVSLRDVKITYSLFTCALSCLKFEVL